MVVLSDFIDIAEPGQSFGEGLVVGVALLEEVEEGRISLHGCRFINQMNNFQEDAYRFWKSKWQSALSSDPNALDDLKIHIQQHTSKEHPLFSPNYATLLKDSSLYQIEKGESYGSYDIWSKVPIFLVLQGHVQMQCINMEGDNEVVSAISKMGILQATESGLGQKFGENNLPLITQFELVGLQKSIVIELSSASVGACTRHLEKINLREEMIMKKYMIIALKHISKVTFSRGMALNDRFYLLEGRACYYHFKTKTILCCYEEGIFSPDLLNSQNIRLHIFQGAYLMLLEGEMLKDEVAIGAETKRDGHLADLWGRYQQMSQGERQRLQGRLIQKYRLNKKEVERDVLCIDRVVEKRVKSKMDMTTTSSSMKEKCGIRIRKTKKII